SFFFQAEDGIRDFHVTGVQTCALPICSTSSGPGRAGSWRGVRRGFESFTHLGGVVSTDEVGRSPRERHRGAHANRTLRVLLLPQIGRASCRERACNTAVNQTLRTKASA